MNWLRRFMEGRHGMDQLNTFLLFLSIIIVCIAQLVNLQWLVFMGYVPLAVGFYRSLSKNNTKRNLENYKFSILVSPIYSKLRQTGKYLQDSRTHRHFSCPACKAKLRAPKGIGKIMVTCNVCHHEFTRKV
ncbi:MAG: hypothetical protein HGA22_12950 [Clostridiales bacterium]|nr:hypothetical protein [Clostridiales bacterium]